LKSLWQGKRTENFAEMSGVEPILSSGLDLCLSGRLFCLEKKVRRAKIKLGPRKKLSSAQGLSSTARGVDLGRAAEEGLLVGGGDVPVLWLSSKLCGLGAALGS